MLKGFVKILFNDAITGEPTQPSVESNNIIYDETLLLILARSPFPIFSVSGFGQPTHISIATQITQPAATNNVMTGIIATGADVTELPPRIYYEDVEPPFIQIVNQFSSPGVPRTFDAVGITHRTTNNNEGEVDAPALTTTILDLVCTQQATEILTIFYFIIIEENYSTNQNFSPRFYQDLGGALIQAKSCDIGTLGTSYATTPADISYIDLYHDRANDLILPKRVPPNSNNFIDWNTGDRIDDHYKWKNIKVFTIANSGNPGDVDIYTGYIFNSMLVGLSNLTQPDGTTYVSRAELKQAVSSCYSMQNYRLPSISQSPGFEAIASPLQPLWGHSPGSDKPFLETIFTQRGLGGIAFNADNWTGGFPEYYKLIITAEGNTGTAEYRFTHRYHLGFNSNTYEDRAVGCPFRNPNIAASPNHHGWSLDYNDVQRYSDTQVVQYDATGITILNLINGEFTTYDADTTPSLPVTELKQIATDGTVIYAGCRNTGLWKIEAGVVTRLVVNPCYGVDIANTVVYGLFEGGLRNSDNWATNLTFSYTDLSTQWSRCLFIRCSRSHPDERVAIIMQSPTSATSRRIIWWDDISATAIATSDNSRLERYPASFNCSHEIEFWVDIGGYKWDYGTDTSSFIASIMIVFGSFGNAYVHPEFGNLATYGRVEFYGEYLVGRTNLIDVNSVNIASYSNGHQAAFTCTLMVGGIFLFGSTLVHLLNNDFAQAAYGWNGSLWVEGNSNNKITHVAAETLIQGITIRFTDNGNPNFISGDWYTQSINYGYLKDNATEIYYENSWYTRLPHFDEAIPGGVIISSSYTLPAAAEPLFLRIETDDIDLLAKFYIDGVEVLTVWLNGNAPQQGEISLDGETGELEFNAADAGKTFTGYYCWLGV